MWLYHLRHLTLTNQQRSSKTTADARRPMGLAHTRSSSVRQLVGHQTVSGRCRCGHGSGDPDHPPHWIRESNVGPREQSGTTAGVNSRVVLARAGKSGPVAGPCRCRCRYRWLHRVDVGSKGQCVCSLSRVLIESISPDQTTTLPGEAGCRGATRQVHPVLAACEAVGGRGGYGLRYSNTE